MRSDRILKAARRRSGLTQRQLAVLSGLPQPTVARIESGAVSPRWDTLMRLLTATGFDIELRPQLGRGVDRSLIRDRLRLTPAERIRLAVIEARRMPTIRLSK